MVSDKTIHKAFRLHKTLQTKPIREFFNYFHYLPKLYIGFKIAKSICLQQVTDLLYKLWIIHGCTLHCITRNLYFKMSQYMTLQASKVWIELTLYPVLRSQQKEGSTLVFGKHEAEERLIQTNIISQILRLHGNWGHLKYESLGKAEIKLQWWQTKSSQNLEILFIVWQLVAWCGLIWLLFLLLVWTVNKTSNISKDGRTAVWILSSSVVLPICHIFVELCHIYWLRIPKLSKNTERNVWSYKKIQVWSSFPILDNNVVYLVLIFFWKVK